MPGTDAIRLSAIVVTYNSRDAVAGALPALVDQLGEGDELIVVDNASSDDTVEMLGRIAPDATLVRNWRNDGFAGAANLGAQHASGELLLFVNHDAAARPGFAEAIRAPLQDGRGWAAWMGLVTAKDGRVVNTNGGVVHFTGIAWAGEAGARAPGTLRGPREVAFLSGACMAVPRATWERIGGFAEDYFMYHEDVEWSLRARLAGARLGIEPAAVVDHDYEFAKGAAKWRRLERNRWATIVRTYPRPLLALLMPGLLATEIALVPVAVRGGWVGPKLQAAADTVRALPGLLRRRRAIQGAGAITALEFARWLTPDLDSPYLGRAAGARPLRLALRAYWAAVLAVLRLLAHLR